MKPNAYTQLYIHLVMAVKFREAQFNSHNQTEIFQYIAGIVNSLKHKSIIVNGYKDHVHILLGLNPNVSISNSVHDIKRNSTIFINENKLCKSNFAWQAGYGAFSYSRSSIQHVYNYILNQEKHHQKQSFKQEYIQLLEKFNIEFKDEFLFAFF